MLHIKILLTVFSTFSIANSYADPYQEFSNRKLKNYSSIGQEKSHGLEINFDYPESWEGLPGRHPNTLYQITSKNGLGFESCNLLVKKLPEEIANELDKNLNFLLEHSTLESFVPSDRKILNIGNTKIDGIPTGLIETQSKAENAGISGYVNSISYFTYYEKKLISFQCMTYAEKKEDSHYQYKKNYRLFNLIANSLIVMNKWR